MTTAFPERKSAVLSKAPSFSLGVDGGGTSTTAVLVDTHTRAEIARTTSSSTNRNSVGAEQALQTLRSLVSDTLAAAALPATAEDLASVCLCMSGVDTPADAERLAGQVETWFPMQTVVRVSNDAAAALASGTGGAPCGCVLIAGTGTLAYARSAEGREARASGWGPAFLDGGSGYDLGQRALAAVARAADGRAPAAINLSHKLCSHCGADSPEDLLRWAYADTMNSCGLDGKFDMVLAGGLLEDHTIYSRMVAEQISAALPEANVIRPQVDAALAAALLAAVNAKGIAGQSTSSS
ncbi:hypothetical protein WJX73_007864 [Symbiochloris irregularis]|uniref:N-acetyl-D-glucosamine kinase n=1 Tax=Symbiochloris irregularis TaxID=706552 RepID=A0AAW1P014_9CHLO